MKQVYETVNHFRTPEAITAVGTFRASHYLRAMAIWGIYGVLTDWKNYFTGNSWHVRINPNKINGLSKVSAVDTLQLRGMDTRRFIQKIGNLSEDKILEITKRDRNFN